MLRLNFEKDCDEQSCDLRIIMGRKKKTAAKEGIKNTLSKNPLLFTDSVLKRVGTFQCIGLFARKFF